MTIQELQHRYVHPDVDLLIALATSQSGDFVALNPRYELSETELASFIVLFRQRAEDDVPYAYLAGTKWFYGRAFAVSPAVLIPRPETEELVDLVLQDIDRRVDASKTPITLLDVGTGSGCIAVTLALSHPSALLSVDASDISEDALRVAQQNAHTHTPDRVRFVHSDLYQSIDGVYDVIVANLPYVPLRVFEREQDSLRFEPRLAITDESEDAQLLSRFIAETKTHVHSGGLIFMEIDPSNEEYIAQTITSVFPNSDVRFLTDLSGRTRFCRIELPIE